MEHSKKPYIRRNDDPAAIAQATIGSSLISNPGKPRSKDRMIVSLLLGVFTLISFLTLMLLMGCGKQSAAQSTPIAVTFVATDGATCYAIMQDGKAVGGNCIR